MKESRSSEVVVFGGGCFWCTEAIFMRLKGVLSVTSGYAGGGETKTNYLRVSEGWTDHAEVVRVEYDPQVIEFKQLLAVFFDTHDPTSLNRQGADVGPEYRSIILTTTQEQQSIAEESKRELTQKHPDRPVVTEIVALDHFYTAEEYHQRFYERNQDNRYCQLVIDPKLEKLSLKYAHLLK